MLAPARTVVSRGATFFRIRGFSSSPPISEGSTSSSYHHDGDLPSRPRRRAASAIRVPKTNWSSPFLSDPAPPAFGHNMIPPLPDSSFASTIKGVAIGPSSSNVTNLRHAERGLRLRLHRHGPGYQLGQHGTYMGVKYITPERARKINARAAKRQRGDDDHDAAAEGDKESSVATVSKTERQLSYLEREGGDYSRFLAPKTSPEDLYSWQSIASKALSTNPTIAPEAAESLIRQVGAIIRGEIFKSHTPHLGRGVPAAKLETPAPPTPPPAAAPTPVKKKRW